MDQVCVHVTVYKLTIFAIIDNISLESTYNGDIIGGFYLVKLTTDINTNYLAEIRNVYFNVSLPSTVIDFSVTNLTNDQASNVEGSSQVSSIPTTHGRPRLFLPPEMRSPSEGLTKLWQSIRLLPGG